MELSLLPAVLAGTGAGLVLTAVHLGIRAAGADLRMDVTRMWSSMLGMTGGAGRAAGLGTHLVMSVAVGLLYALGFRVFDADDALWLWGLLGGLLHYGIAGLVIGAVPAIDRRVTPRIPAPGIYATDLGLADVGGFLVGHLAYGAAFGILYAVLHPAGGMAVAF